RYGEAHVSPPISCFQISRPVARSRQCRLPAVSETNTISSVTAAVDMECRSRGALQIRPLLVMSPVPDGSTHLANASFLPHQRSPPPVMYKRLSKSTGIP